jgi:predicted DNA-binding transcriptional regulator AlpA
MGMHRLISKKEAAKIVGVHPEHIMRMVRQHRFPQPIKLGGSENSAVRFVAEEIEVWIAAQMSAREVRARRYGMRLDNKMRAEKV